MKAKLRAKPPQRGGPPMQASVIPFPLSRRVAFVERHADIIAGMKPDSAERHLAYQLKIQGEALGRRGISAERIERELALLEQAILAAIWSVA